jgi:uncharacterized Zn-binding protein involved in type VI secretion
VQPAPPVYIPQLNPDFISPPTLNLDQPPQPASTIETHTLTHLSVNVNGVPVSMTGQQAVIVQGVSLIPVGDVFRALGYTVSWDNNNRIATLRRRNVTIAIQEGNDSFTVNGIRHNLPVPAIMVNNNLMVPFVEVINALGGRSHRDINNVVHIYMTR